MFKKKVKELINAKDAWYQTIAVKAIKQLEAKAEAKKWLAEKIKDAINSGQSYITVCDTVIDSKARYVKAYKDELEALGYKVEHVMPRSVWARDDYLGHWVISWNMEEMNDEEYL